MPFRIIKSSKPKFKISTNAFKCLLNAANPGQLHIVDEVDFDKLVEVDGKVAL